MDVGHAFTYVHRDCSSPVVHKDITSNNILLDMEFRACISDFDTTKILNIYGRNHKLLQFWEHELIKWEAWVSTIWEHMLVQF